MNRIATFSILMAVLLIVGSGGAVAQAGAATTAAAETPEYVMDGTVETAESVTGPVVAAGGFEEPPAFGLQEPVQKASPVDGPIGIATAEEPRYLL